ncbi:amidohydrolase family protein, partial [bacterium]|nr:amidohydrolase family protein [bacterium]
MKAIYRARVFDPVSDYELNEIPDAILSVDSTGKIDSITPFHEAPEQLCSNAKVLEGESGLQILLPGFCDLHFHWVQDLVCDLPKDHLLEWLNDYVFPEESRFSSEEYSKERAMDFAAKLVRCGTLGGGIYSSIHEPSVIQAMEHLRGDFRLGNVVMTRNSPDYLTEQLEDVKTLCSRLQLRFGPQYVITPRFALSCDPTTLEWLGAFAREHGLYVQTHLSETKTEIVETLNYYRSFPG